MNKKYLFWTPRVLSFLFIIFLMAFSLDIFSMRLDLWQTLVGLFMHNIPAFVVLIFLALSWKHELIGGIAFIVAGIVLKAYISSSFLIYTPPLLIGILFCMGGSRKR